MAWYDIRAGKGFKGITCSCVKSIKVILTPHLSLFVAFGNPRLPSPLMGVKALAISPD